MKYFKWRTRQTGDSPPDSPYLLPVFGGILLILALGFLLTNKNSPESSSAIASAHDQQTLTFVHSIPSRSPRPQRDKMTGTQTAAEIVAIKVLKFGKLRRDLVHAMAKHQKVEVPSDVDRFFDAIASGNWEEIDAAHRALLLDPNQHNQPRSAELHEIWRPIQETWGAAREAHNWPAQTLLDYGNAIMDTLKPGMIYAGGTDPGCFIPTMLNETGEDAPHIVITQNALADGTYLNYLDYLYGDRMSTLTTADSERAFKEYVDDAQKRLEHDQQFPDEPKQLKPGEDVKITDGRVQVSGQVAVMSINEKLFQTLMTKNPDASFAMEESFPFSSLYGSATPLGPVLQLGVQDEQKALTSESAAQSVDYWRSAAENLLSDPETPDGSNPRKAYSKLIASQAGLLAEHKFFNEAEQAFRLATEVYPASPEAVFRLVNLLISQSRFADALGIANTAVSADRNNAQFQDLQQHLSSMSSRIPPRPAPR